MVKNGEFYKNGNDGFFAIFNLLGSDVQIFFCLDET